MIKFCIALALLATISLSPKCNTNVILATNSVCVCTADGTSVDASSDKFDPSTNPPTAKYCKQVGTTYTIETFPTLCTASTYLKVGIAVNAKYTGADCKIDNNSNAGNIICTQNGVYKASATSCPIMPEVCGASGATQLKNTIVTGAICECVANTVCLANHYCWPGTPKICNAAKKTCATGLPSAATPFVTGTGYVTDSSLVATDCPTACTDLLCGKCDAGYGGGSCTACITGTNFKSVTGSAACTACADPICPAGEVKKACTTISNAICECPAGKTGTTNSCTSCITGTNFKSVTGSAACTACDNPTCPAGEFKQACTKIADTICECPAGKTGTTGSCTSCTAGTNFKTGPGPAACTACADPTCTNGEIKKACTKIADAICECPAGKTGTTGSCTVCTAGTNFKTGPGPNACTACDNPTCPAGKITKACTTIADTICECDAGYGGDSCTVCTVGTNFKIATGPAACTPCTVCTSPKVEDTACTTTADRTCKTATSASSSMSVGVQTAVLIGMMNFV